MRATLLDRVALAGRCFERFASGELGGATLRAGRRKAFGQRLNEDLKPCDDAAMISPSSTAHDYAKLWQLDRAITFLNHGSFGACPTQVLKAQRHYQDQLEAEPVRFFTRIAPPLLDAARNALADFLRAEANDLVFVSNATAGVNCVLRSLRFEKGDELLTTDHAYLACQNTLDYVAQREGLKVVTVSLPMPVTSPEQIVEAITAGVTPRTKLAMIDHVTSGSGMILPIEKIVHALQSRGIDVLVDGAHAPGMVNIDLNSLNAAYYTGNLHKWVCAPKGAGFLHVRSDKQDPIMPSIISHGYRVPRPHRSRFHDRFDWIGTLDVTPWLCVKDALDFIRKLLPGSINELMQRNRALALRGRQMLLVAFGSPLLCPDEMIGQMATVILPDDPDPDHGLDWTTSPTPQHRMMSQLMREYQIEVPVYYFAKAPRRAVRISAQVYNDEAQYEKLIAAINEIVARGG